MTEIYQKTPKRDLLLKPLISIILLAGITIGTFLFFHQQWIESLSEKVELQHRRNISQIAVIARNTIEPILIQYRGGKIGRNKAINEIRKTVRQMTYRDGYGDNYVFMSAYDGTMLVQPFEPHKEMTNQWDLRDNNRVYIIRELVKAAKSYPDGSFVKYHYYLPEVHSLQEKLAYVIGIPELECYIGTGMYMQMAVQEQKDILKRVKFSSILFFISILIPLSVAMLFILNRNRLLLNEISSREAIEDELKKSEEKYRSIFENVPQGIYQTEPDGRFRNANKTLAKMYGYTSAEEMIKNTFNIAEQYYAEPCYRENFLRMMKEKGYVEKFLTKFKRIDGTFFWGTNNAREVKDENGNVLYYEGSIEDITSLIEAQTKAEQSEEKFSKIFLTSPELIAITRLYDGKFIDVNPGFEKITGWRKDELAGLTSLDINFWNDISHRQEMFDELKTAGTVLYREVNFRRKDGTLRNGIYSARTITIADEECLVFAMHDITKNKQMAEEQRRLEQQLFHSQKMDAIGKLAGGVAHDFNNILGGIQGLVSLMLIKSPPDDPMHNRLTKIEEQIQRGSSLTKQLLNLAHEGKNEKTVIDINELLRKSVEIFTETKKGIEISFKPGSNIHPIKADSGQIDQVILNLLINADHAMPDGGFITLQTDNITINEKDSKRFELIPGDYVKISVSDTGTGMDSGTVKKIFEPFFTTKAERGGTGLGLASAYGIIRNHDGVLSVYSEPGHGSTFNIYLPSSCEAIKEESLPVNNIFYGSGTILIVDDEHSILEAVSEMLHLLGYRVLQASSGEEAISIYSEQKDTVSLVILDMIMPVMSGSQVLKALREIDPEVKVILSSGYVMQGNAVKVLADEYSSFMQKPYSIIDLSRLVHEAINS
jgi:PAS domain S-box-containing protein